MNACLTGKAEIPDRRETLVDWDGFIVLMLAAWIRRFTDEIPAANRVLNSGKRSFPLLFALDSMIGNTTSPHIEVFLAQNPEAAGSLILRISMSFLL